MIWHRHYWLVNKRRHVFTQHAPASIGTDGSIIPGMDYSQYQILELVCRSCYKTVHPYRRWVPGPLRFRFRRRWHETAPGAQQVP